MSMLSKRMCWIMAVTLVCVGPMVYGFGTSPDHAVVVPPDQGGGQRDLVTIASGANPAADGYLEITPDDYGSWADVGFGGGGDFFVPNGFAGGAPTFSCGVFMFVGDRRQLLTDNATYLPITDDDSMAIAVNLHTAIGGDTNADGVDDTVFSAFDVTGGVALKVELTQHVYWLNAEGSGISELEQVYVINNLGPPVDLVLVTTYDGDILYVGDFTDDSVGTDTAAAKNSAFEQEAGTPATRIRVWSPQGTDYYGGRNGIDPDGGGYPFGFGTDVQIWDSFGVPDGTGGAGLPDGSDWRNHIAGVGYNTNGESGAAPAGCGVPCDGFVGVQIPVSIDIGASATVTIYHTYGAKKLCGNGELDAGEECDPPFDEACPGECRDDCTCPLKGDIPTVSQWGMIVIGLLTVVVGVIVFTRWRPVEPGTPDAS